MQKDRPGLFVGRLNRLSGMPIVGLRDREFGWSGGFWGGNRCNRRLEGVWNGQNGGWLRGFGLSGV